MRLRNSIRPLLLLLMLVSHCAMAQDVTVSVDRSTVFLGDTLTLTIDVIDPRSDEDLVSPDLTVLDDSFVVMNTGNTSIVNVVNGQKSTRISHTAMLEPKAAGDLTIPAITVGRMQTTPMQITVMERAASSSTSSERDLFIEAEVDQLSPYVQQQVILTVRLYHAHSILDGAIDRPEIADAVVEEISNNETYRTRIDERAYRVIERRYLVFAERSGELEIPPITFRGRIANSTNQRLLYSRSSRVSERTLPITLNVKPVPDSFTGDVWIPSSGVELREEWLDGEPQFTEGEPLTRRLVLTVSGLLSTQIPDVPVPEDPAFRIYPDDDITRMRAAQNLSLIHI